MTSNPIGGFLLLRKPPHISSHSALHPVKKCFQCKVGHTGTLDPMATGTLVCAIGQARKFIQFISSDAKKSYRGVIQLGMKTNTGDITGEVIDTQPPVDIHPELILKSLNALTGKIMQSPPIYSALKYKGKAYYTYARSGKNIPIQAREVTIERLDLKGYSMEKQQIAIEATVGAGTYIRTLAEDIAQQLNTVGCLASLERLTIEPWACYPQYSAEEIIQLENLDTILLPIESGLAHLNKIVLEQDQIAKLQHGIKIVNHTGLSCGQYRLYKNEAYFCGVVEVTGSQIRSSKLIQIPD